MQAQREVPADMQCRDKFLLQCVVVSSGVTAKDITPELFNKESGNQVDEFKLKVTYVPPPQPPSPVREGSEEGSSPRASVSDNGTVNQATDFNIMSKAFVEPQESVPEVKALISKLTEEKQYANQQIIKLGQELDLLKRQGHMMDETMKQFQRAIIEVEIEAENLLLARHELVEIDRMRNGNREALTALRKRARTTKTSVPLPFESIMRDIESRPLVKEVCSTCGDHNSQEKSWLMFPGTDVFATMPFHAVHSILDKDQARLDFESKKLQSYVKEKSFLLSEKGVLADKISPGVLRSLLTLTDKPKIEEKD